MKFWIMGGVGKGRFYLGKSKWGGESRGGDLTPKWLVSGDETRPSIGWGPRLTGRILTLMAE